MLAWRRALVVLFALSVAAGYGYAQEPEIPTRLLNGTSGMRWRPIGPMRGGRSVADAGVPSEPDVFYFGGVDGGVFKTENAGRTWTELFGHEPVQSIGAIAVSPSNPDIIYVGTGEADIRSQNSFGDGMYKSTDGGKTWEHIGLANTRRIGRVLVDPHDPNRVYVAALGHAYTANADRGVYRSLDGGRTWKKVLYHGPDVGAINLAMDPNHPMTIYASLWATRRPPWVVYAPSNMPDGGLYKSADGGDTWTQLTSGLPDDGHVGRIGVAVAPSNSDRVWAVVDDLADKGSHGGIYISDDAGATWRQVNNENRLWGRGWYFGEVEVDPSNQHRAFVMNTATYLTDNDGQTFTPIKGAPGGDDYHQLWINPRVPNHMVLSSDQGTEVSLDGGKTWSSWYNQNTAQLYHISASSGFPWWVYGPQQDSGAVGVQPWSNEGQISFRNWIPLCAGGESDIVVPDPDDSDYLYGGAGQRCNQKLNIRDSLGSIPRPGPGQPVYRKTWTLPLVFSRADKALYYANQYVFRTRDQGRTWQRISPDLTRVDPGIPSNLDPVTAHDNDARGVTTRKGVVYSLAPSPLAANTIWAGTDDGYIQLTTDGGQTWTNVTPPELTPWSKITSIGASRFDVNSAYASVDRHRLGDFRPYIYRTRNGGKSWSLISNGIPDMSYVQAVKEDPVRRGLLYAATEFGVYVSFNGGDKWQSLQSNLPHTSARDLLIHGDSLVVATFGRGVWVMDDINPLRQLTPPIAAEDVHLYQPGVALAIHQGSMNGTPLPPEVASQPNPPAGAFIYYSLRRASLQPLTLEILDASGKVINTFHSNTPVTSIDTEKINIVASWIPKPERLGTSAGMHRFVWNLRPAPRPQPAGRGGFGALAAMFGFGRGAQMVAPGTYTVRLIVDGKTYSQPLAVKPDPRLAQ
ncbi:MAG: WD40/YVTN/BNR-like repeat-containing protein [Terriglobales bacterium]